ncbi:MAG: ABC transporter permease, partial [Anaerolineae bacterium]|nr:ABC transporter permease [Anaerolineae bacterium]
MRLWDVYRIVFRKEFRELLRDRRSLFWLFAPPIILPGIALCAGIFIGTQAIRIASEGFPVIVENAEEAPGLVQRLADEEGLLLLDDETQEEAVLIITLPEDFQERLANQETASISLTSRNNSLVTFVGKTIVRGVIDAYNQELLDQRLESRSLSREWLTPIQVGERTETETVGGDDQDGGGRSVLATIFLPLAVTSWLLGGGMGLVLDSTVGEKERQTIENLLVTPASRVGIVLGKMTVIFIASMAVMGLWLIEGVLLNALGSAGSDMSNNLSAADLLTLLLESGGSVLGLIIALVILVVPFTVMLNALVMAWCAYAANYREANLFMALVQLGLPASVLLTIFS